MVVVFVAAAAAAGEGRGQDACQAAALIDAFPFLCHRLGPGPHTNCYNYPDLLLLLLILLLIIIASCCNDYPQYYCCHHLTIVVVGINWSPKLHGEASMQKDAAQSQPAPWWSPCS